MTEPTTDGIERRNDVLKRLLAPLLVPLMFAVVLVSAPPAGAIDPNPPGCPRGNFCAYRDWAMTGPPLVSTPGNWWGMTPGVGSVFNNGVPYPGADHIQLTFGWPNGTIEEVCIHYNPGPGHKVNFGTDVVILRATWRGEC